MRTTAFLIVLSVGLAGLQAASFQPAPGVKVDKFVEVPKDVKPSKAADKVPEGVMAQENLVFGTGGGRELKLDLYAPKGDGPFPGVVVVHGGGWTGGNKEAFRSMAQQLAAKGFVAVTIDYRLAGEAQFPGAVEDCKAAVRWMRANGKKYHIDPKRIGGVGGSAGGHLIGMVATTAKSKKFEGSGGNEKQSSGLQACVMMGAGIDQATRAAETPKPIQNQLVFFGGTYADKKDLYVAGSPITHLSKDTPPILLIEGEFDSPGERYVEFRQKLDALKVPNRLVIVQGGKHGCWGSNPWFTPFVEEIAGFLHETLK
jgi:acetyl esterase/lipase